MDMNSPKGKEILALVRKADYAHAGEEDAIDIVFKDIPKDPKRLLLDVGCGRGGTARYIQRSGWGKVVGIDIDPESVGYAKKTYPDVEFIVADATDFDQGPARRFDIVYLFNTFYAFSDHRRTLEQLRASSRKGGQLIVFDYLLKSENNEDFPFKEWNPLGPSVIQRLFPEAGWHVVKTDDITDLYERWYKGLVSRIEASSEEISALAGKEWFDFVITFYRRIVIAIERKSLGGAVVYALNDK